MSPSLLGRSVPCQAGTSRSGGLLRLAFCAFLGAGSVEPTRSTALRSLARSSVLGGLACRIVHGLLTSGLISGKFLRSSSVGCQVLPSGGPKSAHDFKSLARSVVVNLASSDENAAIGGVVNAS